MEDHLIEEVVEEKIDLLIRDLTYLIREEMIEKTQAIENEKTIDPKILMKEEMKLLFYIKRLMTKG